MEMFTINQTTLDKSQDGFPKQSVLLHDKLAVFDGRFAWESADDDVLFTGPDGGLIFVLGGEFVFTGSAAEVAEQIADTGVDTTEFLATLLASLAQRCEVEQ